MKQYIDKDIIKAEIERKISSCYLPTEYTAGIKYGLGAALKIIDTLEVKEVDLDLEIQQHINDCLDIKFPTTDIKMIAKDVEYTARKFFELGLKAKGG